MRMRRRDYLLLDFKFFLGVWHRISVFAKAANGFIEKMCLLWKNGYEGKYVVHAQNKEN